MAIITYSGEVVIDDVQYAYSIRFNEDNETGEDDQYDAWEVTEDGNIKLENLDILEKIWREAEW